MIRFVEATERHALILAPSVRTEDVLELQRLSGDGPLEALLEGVRRSRMAVTVEDDGFPIAMWGFAPTEIEGIYTAWMLGSRQVDEYPVAMVKEGRKAVDAMLAADGVDALVNLVDASYVRALAWLAALGFTFSEPQDFGTGYPFCWAWRRHVPSGNSPGHQRDLCDAAVPVGSGCTGDR